MSTPSQEPTRDDAAYKAALHRAETLRAYYTHLLVYLVVNAGLFFINLLTRGETGAGGSTGRSPSGGSPS